MGACQERIQGPCSGGRPNLWLVPSLLGRSCATTPTVKHCANLAQTGRGGEVCGRKGVRYDPVCHLGWAVARSGLGELKRGGHEPRIKLQHQDPSRQVDPPMRPACAQQATPLPLTGRRRACILPGHVRTVGQFWSRCVPGWPEQCQWISRRAAIAPARCARSQGRH